MDKVYLDIYYPHKNWILTEYVLLYVAYSKIFIYYYYYLFIKWVENKFEFKRNNKVSLERKAASLISALGGYIEDFVLLYYTIGKGQKKCKAIFDHQFLH